MVPPEDTPMDIPERGGPQGAVHDGGDGQREGQRLGALVLGGRPADAGFKVLVL